MVWVSSPSPGESDIPRKSDYKSTVLLLFEGVTVPPHQRLKEKNQND